jgi:hypothetical protein
MNRDQQDPTISVPAAPMSKTGAERGAHVEPAEPARGQPNSPTVGHAQTRQECAGDGQFDRNQVTQSITHLSEAGL